MSSNKKILFDFYLSFYYDFKIKPVSSCEQFSKLEKISIHYSYVTALDRLTRLYLLNIFTPIFATLCIV